MEKCDYEVLDELITKAKEGSDEAKEEIINKYIRYVYKKAFIYNVSAFDFEDLVSTGIIAILECIKKYDKDKNSNFTSYVIMAINNNILNSQMKYHRKTKLNTPIEEVAVSLVDENDDYEKIITEMECKRLKKALASLNEDEKKLIDNIYFKQRSLKSIGTELKITHVAVIYHRNKILKKLLIILEK